MTILIKKVTIIVLLLFYNNNIYANDNNENSLPVLYLSGNFGYDYQEGTITLVMPDGTKKDAC